MTSGSTDVELGNRTKRCRHGSWWRQLGSGSKADDGPGRAEMLKVRDVYLQNVELESVCSCGGVGVRGGGGIRCRFPSLQWSWKFCGFWSSLKYAVTGFGLGSWNDDEYSKGFGQNRGGVCWLLWQEKMGFKGSYGFVQNHFRSGTMSN
ncbi:hypothetical protein TorRG33x02_221990, partial [Trema orientale]